MALLVNVLVGLFYSTLSAALIIVNVVVLTIIYRHKEFNTNTYRIIKHMIFGCMMQLCSHFLGGLMTVSDSNIDFYVERVAGAWIQSGWFLYLGASLALAVDRSLTFVFVVSARTTVIISWSLLASAWLTALLYLVCLLLPGFGFTYHSDHGYFDWFYDKQPATKLFLTLEMAIDFSILVSVLLLYFLVFMRLIMMRQSGNASISSSVVELRILGIAVISFLYESTYLLWFFWGSSLIESSVFSSVIVQTLWIVDCGLFSVATIVINGSIRRKVVQLFEKPTETRQKAFVRKKKIGTTSKFPTVSSLPHK